MATNGIGIDLVARGHEVRKILFAGFNSAINRYSLDPDDVVQEVLKGIMARNAGKCPFDPRKSSFGHYVHMVCGCIVKNLIRKARRQAEKEQVGVYSQSGDEQYGHTVDAAVAARSDRHGGQSEETPDTPVATAKVVSALLATVGPEDTELAERVIPMLLEGRTRNDISKMLGKETASRAFAVLQDAGTRSGLRC